MRLVDLDVVDEQHPPTTRFPLGQPQEANRLAAGLDHVDPVAGRLQALRQDGGVIRLRLLARELGGLPALGLDALRVAPDRVLQEGRHLVRAQGSQTGGGAAFGHGLIMGWALLPFAGDRRADRARRPRRAGRG
jgi:hypothetical protein